LTREIGHPVLLDGIALNEDEESAESEKDVHGHNPEVSRPLPPVPD
jgi:hypothetical protein